MGRIGEDAPWAVLAAMLPATSPVSVVVGRRKVAALAAQPHPQSVALQFRLLSHVVFTHCAVCMRRLLHAPAAKRAYEADHITILPAWPPHSPDLNPQVWLVFGVCRYAAHDGVRCRRQENVWPWAEKKLRELEKPNDTFEACVVYRSFVPCATYRRTCRHGAIKHYMPYPCTKVGRP